MGLDEYAPTVEYNLYGRNGEISGTGGFQYYIDRDRRIKYTMSADGEVGNSKQMYWTRSRHYSSSYSDRVCCVYISGNSSYWDCDGYALYAPAFAIGTNYTNVVSGA